MFKAYIFKLSRSPSLYVGIIGVIALCCTSFLTYNFFYGDVVNHINIFLNIGVYRKTMAVFAALPFAGNFAEEWTNNVTMGCILRKGVRKYGGANILFCFFSSLITVFLGMIIFSGLYSLFIPLYIPDGNPYGFIFGQFLENNQGGIFIALRILVFAYSCAMWSVMGMALSALFPNKYAAICAPFVASYVVERISIQLPDDLSLWYISLSLVYFENDLLGFLYCTGIFTAISAAFGAIFIFLVRKRVQNEIT